MASWRPLQLLLPEPGEPVMRIPSQEALASKSLDSPKPKIFRSRTLSLNGDNEAPSKGGARSRKAALPSFVGLVVGCGFGAEAGEGVGAARFAGRGIASTVK